MNRRALLAWAGVVAYMGLIFYLSAQQDPLPTLTRAASDKVLHACEYAGLATAWLLALRSSGVRPGVATVLAVIAASVYGATDEVHQMFVPGRSSDVLDWIADSVGAGCIGVLAFIVQRARNPAGCAPAGSSGPEPARERRMR